MNENVPSYAALAAVALMLIAVCVSLVHSIAGQDAMVSACRKIGGQAQVFDRPPRVLCFKSGLLIDLVAK